MINTTHKGFRISRERPEEEISFDVEVCSAEFPEGCIKSAGDQKEALK